MKPNEKNRAINPGEELDHALNAMRAEQPDQETMNAAGERVWQRVSQEAAFPSTAQVLSIRGCEDVAHCCHSIAPDSSLQPAHCWWNIICMNALPVVVRRRPANGNAAFCRRGSRSFRRSQTQASAGLLLQQLSSFLPSQLTLCRTTSFLAQGMRARVESLNGVLSRVGYSGTNRLKWAMK